MKNITTIKQNIESIKLILQEKATELHNLQIVEQALLEEQRNETEYTEAETKLERIKRITLTRQATDVLQANIANMVQQKAELEDEFIGHVLELVNQRDEIEAAFSQKVKEAMQTQLLLKQQLRELATNRMQIRGMSLRVRGLLNTTLSPTKAQEINATIRNIEPYDLANTIRKLFVAEAIPAKVNEPMTDIVR